MTAPHQLPLMLLLCIVAGRTASYQLRNVALARRHQSEHTVGSTIHFGGDSATTVDNTRSLVPPTYESDLDSSYRRLPRNLDPTGASSSLSSYHYQPHGQSFSEPLEWAASNDLATFARGSNEDDSFTLQSAPNRGSHWSSGMRRGPQKQSNRITFGPSSSIAVSSSYAVGESNRRSKRSPPMLEQRRSYPPMYMNNYNNYHAGYGGYKAEPEENCYYHTLVNGDSEVSFRLLLPIRLRGRTIVRKCIQPTPSVHDPRYKVLLRGSNQGSFGNLRVTAKI